LFYIALKAHWPVHSRSFKEHSRKVSAHYVIDRNGDIYQTVNDTDCANHCGANAGSIGIEHVGSETDSLAPPQAAASAGIDTLVLQEHQISRARNTFGHDFAPGYCDREGPVVRTSCSPGALTARIVFWSR